MEGFIIPTSHRCPISIKSQGVAEIDPSILGMFAGAVKDKDEWLVILLGERKEGGLHIIVDDLYVPRGQQRAMATCSTDEPLPANVIPRVVGALHSHNSMMGKFSATDRSAGGLNSRFPFSIVISTMYTNQDQEATVLGFAYEAEGRFDLPCGNLGVAQFSIVPSGVEDWPWPAEVILATHKGELPHIGDCVSWRMSEDSSPYFYKRAADCGISETLKQVRGNAFGEDGAFILSKLPEATRYVTTYSKYGENKVWDGQKFGNRRDRKRHQKEQRQLEAAGKISGCMVDGETGELVMIYE